MGRFGAAWGAPAGSAAAMIAAAAHWMAFRLRMPTPYPAAMDAITSSPTPAQHAAAEPLVRIQDLHLTLPSAAGPVNILRGVDLDVAAGEAVGVTGRSGSGKTSLLMVLAGLEQASAGSVRVAGHELGRMNEDALA